MCFKILVGCTIVFCFFSIACSQENNENLFPDGYTLSKESEFMGMLDRVCVYSVVSDSIYVGGLIGYPQVCRRTNCGKDCNTIQWIDFNDLEKKEATRLIDIISEENEGGNKRLSYLLEQLKSKNGMLFSGCYTSMLNVRGKSYNFYEYMYFLDINKKELIVFDYLDDY